MKHTIYICKKTMNEVAIRDLRKQLQEQEQKQEKRTAVGAKYKNLQKIHECT